MSKFSKIQYFILIFLTAVLIQNTCFSYEIINATTLENLPSGKKIQEEEQELPFYDTDLPNYDGKDTLSEKLENRFRNFIKKRKESKETNDNSIEAEVQIQEDKTTSNSAQKEETVDDKNKFQINADKITYDDTDGNIYAKGHVEIIAKSQDVTLKADNATLDKAHQTIKLENNVKILKDGIEMNGEYLLVDLNEENILMDNPVLNAYSFIIKAQEGYLIADDIQMINGSIQNAGNKSVAVASSGFQVTNPSGFIDLYDYGLDDTSALKDGSKLRYAIDSKEIVITSYKDHNSILLKNSNIYYKGHKIAPRADFEFISDKDKNVTEISIPEAGNIRDFGLYAGYGFLLKAPKGQIIKLMPAVVYGDHNWGLGVIGRHRSKNNFLEAGYTTASDMLVVKGKYRIGNRFNLTYGKNSYLNEGIYGSRRPGYGVQLEYADSFENKDLNLFYEHSLGAGFYSDYSRRTIADSYYATTRFRYMGQLTKNLIEFSNKEQDMKIALDAISQGAATVYGSGQTTGIIKVGPTLRSQVKYWESSIGYLFGGTHGDSPFYFDKYMYGKSSVYLNEKLNFKNKFALGYRATITPNKDNYEDKFLTESSLYAMAGPQDVKLVLSYDFVRQTAHLGFLLMVGMKSTKIDFDKLTTKDMRTFKKKNDFYRHKRIKIEEETL